MATRQLLPNTTSSATFFRALTLASTARTCPHACRTLTFSSTRSQSSKRELYTAPSYQPHSLPHDFPMPPRNTNIPETSIATPRTHPAEPESRQAQEQEQNTSQSTTDSSSPASPPPSQQSETTAQQPQPKKPKRRTKLRPIKAALSISPSALLHLRNLLSQPTPQLIRIGVRNRGCSGLAYHLEYVDKPGSFDEVVEQEGVKVLIDSKALFSIIGSEMDWVEDKLSARFVFRNPNVTESCGCGESFSVS